MKLETLKQKICQQRPYITDYILFLNSENNIFIGTISNLYNARIDIETFDEEGNKAGYMSFCIPKSPEKWIYLSSVYCYYKYRGQGIATKMNQIAEYALRDYKGYLIRGEYQPFQISDDTNPDISPKLLCASADKFYERAGYLKIPTREYSQENPQYSFLTKEDFIINNDEVACLLVKQIPEEYTETFIRKDDILIDKNMYEKYKVLVKQGDNND